LALETKKKKFYNLDNWYQMVGGGFMHGKFNKDGKASGDDLVMISKSIFFSNISLQGALFK
jgi:hypothetical protein